MFVNHLRKMQWSHNKFTIKFKEILAANESYLENYIHNGCVHSYLEKIYEVLLHSVLLLM